MKKKMIVLMLSAVFMLSILSWIIDNVFGRTLGPGHGQITTPTTTQVVMWNGQIKVIPRSQYVL